MELVKGSFHEPEGIPRYCLEEVAMLFTSGATGARLKLPARNPLGTVAALVRADAREHAEAVDVSLARRISNCFALSRSSAPRRAGPVTSRLVSG